MKDGVNLLLKIPVKFLLVLCYTLTMFFLTLFKDKIFIGLDQLYLRDSTNNEQLNFPPMKFVYYKIEFKKCNFLEF